ncbi:hypothetical protein BNJ_00052 [Kaumoebavirus]|nr:hypothetical protein BNJ_00052 [Kaumoebavirus]ARA71895.1 hypothetical protein BNJ_00052 [Kaumoebavirus]
MPIAENYLRQNGIKVREIAAGVEIIKAIHLVSYWGKKSNNF